MQMWLLQCGKLFTALFNWKAMNKSDVLLAGSSPPTQSSLRYLWYPLLPWNHLISAVEYASLSYAP